MNVRHAKILGDLWVNKSRSLLIVLAVAVGVAAFGLMITGRIVLEENLTDVYAATVPAHTTLALSPFDDDLLEFVQRMDSVAAAQPGRLDQARIKAGADVWLSLELHTIPTVDLLAVNKLTLEEGASALPAPHSILLERSLKNIMTVGDRVEVQLLNGEIHVLTVAGFVNDLSHLPSEITLGGVGFISADTAEVLDLESEYNQLSVIFTTASTRNDVEKETTHLVEEIEDEGYSVFSAAVPVPGKYALGDNMSSVLFILGALGVLTLILSAFLVTSVMSAMMSQQIPQIGILKSLGARIQQTMWLYFQEVLLFGVIALLLAIPMGLIGGYFLADGVATGMNFNVDHFSLPAVTLILQVFSALLAPLLASLFPIIQGSRITIRDAISNYTPDTTGTGAGGRRLLADLPQLVNLSILNTFRRKGRLLLTFAALLLAGAMFIAIIGIRQSMRAAVAELQGDLNYDVGVDLARPYSISKMKDAVLDIEGVRAAEVLAVGEGRLVFNDDHLTGSILMYGVPVNAVMTQPGVILGNWLSTNTRRGIFVNADFLDLSPGLKIGSVVTLNIAGREEQWSIVGATGRGFIPVAYVLYDDLARQTGLDGLANRLVVQTERTDPASQSRAQSDILARFESLNLDVLGSQTTTQLKETNAAQMDVLIILLMSMVILIALVGGLGLAITMSLNVIERTREIGILRSLGAQNNVVRRVVIIEGLVIGLISWAVSIPCSIPLAIWLGNSLGNSLLARPLDYIFSWPAALAWLALVCVISVVASLIPAQSAAKLTIRDALVYE
jgi:putative ABC transport system permease protein